MEGNILLHARNIGNGNPLPDGLTEADSVLTRRFHHFDDIHYSGGFYGMLFTVFQKEGDVLASDRCRLPLPHHTCSGLAGAECA